MGRIIYIYLLSVYATWTGLPVPLEQFERQTKQICMQNQK